MTLGRKAFLLMGAGAAVAPAVSLAITAAPASAGGAGSCHGFAKIQRLDNTSYQIWGEMRCTDAASLRITCYPVHKHTVGAHSHTGSQIAEGPRNFKANQLFRLAPSRVSGTDGDRYKTHCNFDKYGSRIFVDESDSINL